MGGSCLAHKLVVKLAVVPNDDGRKQGVEVCIRSNGANKGALSSLPVPDMVSFESPALQRNHKLQKSESGPRIGTKIGPRIEAKIGTKIGARIERPILP